MADETRCRQTDIGAGPPCPLLSSAYAHLLDELAVVCVPSPARCSHAQPRPPYSCAALAAGGLLPGSNRAKVSVCLGLHGGDVQAELRYEASRCMQLGGVCESSCCRDERAAPPAACSGGGRGGGLRTCRFLSWMLRYFTRSACTSSSSLCPAGLRSSLLSRAPARRSSSPASCVPGAGGPDHTLDTSPASQLNHGGEAAMGRAVVRRSERSPQSGVRHTKRWP